MAQQKANDKGNAARKPAGKAPVKGGKKAPARPQRTIDPERYTVKPEFWDGIFDSLPPWGDEIAAILLIVFGVVSFLSLLNVTTDATISTAWSNAMTQLFGWGSMVVSAGIFALGAIILLPKLGMVIRFPARRILSLEMAFLSLLALLHLLSGDIEARTLARDGQGGGQVGWALSTLISGLFGNVIALMFFGGLLLLSIALVLGVRSAHIKALFRGLQNRANAFGVRMAAVAEAGREQLRQRKALTEGPAPDTLGTVLRRLDGVPEPPKRPAVTVLRIRANMENIPPSMRPGAQPAAPVEEVEEILPAEKSPPDPPPPSGADHPLFSRRANGTPVSLGTIVGKKVKGGVMQIERPDGRIKRYFSVEGLKEARVTPKRSVDLPPMGLLRDIELNEPDENEINTNAVLIENTLLEFDIDIDVVDVKVGPTVTQYAIQPFREVTGGTGETTMSRTRISKIASLASDLALALSARRLRMETPVPGHSYIGIEVPNKNPSTVALRSVYESRSFHEEMQKSHSPLFVPIGRDVSGYPVGVDLATMPHLLIAGTTGSGKSVCMAALATALVMNNMPDVMKMIMLDPKMVELSRFNSLPHLLGPVETDLERIIGVLRWCTREMERRYKVLEEAAARNIDTYNERLGKRRKAEHMPYIVIMIDEIGDLMMSKPEETEKTITRLAQMARAVGMHLVVATQRPSVDVITGLIKANFPSRMSFQVASGIDSRVILDVVGAETLMGKGDMLFYPAEATAPKRVQGCFVSDDEVRAVIEHWRVWHEQQMNAGKSEGVGIGPWERGLTRREFLSETDPMLEQAIELVVAEGEASASLIQRRLGLGYPRAARIMDLLAELGIIGEVKAGGRGREVLIKPGKDPFKDLIDKRMKGQ